MAHVLSMNAGPARPLRGADACRAPPRHRHGVTAWSTGTPQLPRVARGPPGSDAQAQAHQQHPHQHHSMQHAAMQQQQHHQPRAAVILGAAGDDGLRPVLRDARAAAASKAAAAAPLTHQQQQQEQQQQQQRMPSAAESASAASDAIEAAAGLLFAPYYAYARALEERPLLTKALTSFVGFMIGDVIAQHLAHPDAPLDALRVLRLGAYGLCIDGPLGAIWYDWLEANISPESPKSTQAVLIKTALDQVVYASVGTVLFFSVVTVLEGRPAAVPAVVAAKLLPTLAANYAIWPLAHLINFRFVPAPYRVAYNNVVAIGWLALLSMITHSKSSSSVLTHLVKQVTSLLHLHT